MTGTRVRPRRPEHKPCAGHPRLSTKKSWMAGTSPAMTSWGIRVPTRDLLQGFLVRIDDVPCLLIVGRENRLVAHALPGLETCTFLDVVILDLQHAGLGPLAAGAIGPIAHDCLVRVLSQMVGNLVVVDTFRAGDRFAQHINIRVAPAAEIVA